MRLPPKLSNDVLKLKVAVTKADHLREALEELREGLPGFILNREDVQELIRMNEALAKAIADVKEGA
jgi:3-dehydroquinate synthase class II